MHIKTGEPTFEFATVEELRGWLDKEAEFWGWVTNVRWDTITYPFGGFSGLFALRESVARESEVPSNEIPPEWLERLRRLYLDGEVLYSGSREAQFIEGLRRKSGSIAAGALATLVGSMSLSVPTGYGHQRDELAPRVEGMIEAIVFSKLIARDERQSLERLRDEWTAALVEAKMDNERMRQQQAALSAALQRFVDEQQRIAEELSLRMHLQEREHADLRRRHASEWEALLRSGEQQMEARLEKSDERAESLFSRLAEKSEEAERRIEQITQTYTQHMALKAPVTYWEENRKAHLGEAKKYLRLLSVFAPLGLVAIGASGWFLLGKDETPQWGHALLFFVLAGMVVWGLRLLVRLYLSHVHLQTDAHERIVMAKTYLALSSEGITPTAAENAIVFGTLFRPAVTGVSADDNMPPSTLDLVSKLLKGDK